MEGAYGQAEPRRFFQNLPTQQYEDKCWITTVSEFKGTPWLSLELQEELP